MLRFGVRSPLGDQALRAEHNPAGRGRLESAFERLGNIRQDASTQFQRRTDLGNAGAEHKH